MNWQMGVIWGTEALFLAVGSYYDWKTRTLPLGFLLFFAGVGVLWNVLWRYQHLESVVFGVCFGVIFFAVSKATKEAVGIGDAWGILAIGLFEGWRGAVSLVLCAFVLSSIYGVYQMMRAGKKAEDTIPFFPFLFLACLGGFLL